MGVVASEPWIYAGICQGCGEIVEAVLGNYAEEIGQMAMDGLIVIRRKEPVAGSRCNCLAVDDNPAPTTTEPSSTRVAVECGSIAPGTDYLLHEIERLIHQAHSGRCGVCVQQSRA